LEKTRAKLWGSKKITSSKPACLSSEANHTAGRKKKGKTEVCCVCGKHSLYMIEVGLPSFLLFASSNATKSFNSQGKNPAKLAGMRIYIEICN